MIYSILHSIKDAAGAEQLRTHMATLRRIRGWREGSARDARVLLVLVSPDLLDDDRLIAVANTRNRQGAIVVPVLYRPCPWGLFSKHARSGALGGLRPATSSFVTSSSNVDQAWSAVVSALYGVT